METQQHKDLITLEQLCEILQVGKSFVYCHTRHGSCDRLPAFKVGKHLRFSRQEIEKWLQEHRN
jgi:excisionase family DNA binding protein